MTDLAQLTIEQKQGELSLGHWTQCQPMGLWERATVRKRSNDIHRRQSESNNVIHYRGDSTESLDGVYSDSSILTRGVLLLPPPPCTEGKGLSGEV